MAAAFTFLRRLKPNRFRPYRLHRESYSTNPKQDSRGIVSPTLHQRCGICWAISTVRHFAAIIKRYGYIAEDEQLSIQDLVQQVHALHPEVCNSPDYSLDDVLLAESILRESGICVERRNRLSYDFDSLKNHKPTTRKYTIRHMDVVYSENYLGDKFEKGLLRALKRSPVACSVRMFPSYHIIKGKDLYDPDMSNEVERPSLHMMLLVASGKTKKRQPFLEFQDSFGHTVGDNGFVRVRGGRGIVADYVRITPA
uniref:Senescence-specific cysteine protease SAG39 n=1 Tax=Noccaea caerulescens TaxID=107243 RepID=A0A1J3DFX9_NOCCA